MNANRKNAADDKLKELMRRFADTLGRQSRIVLISGKEMFHLKLAPRLWNEFRRPPLCHYYLFYLFYLFLVRYPYTTTVATFGRSRPYLSPPKVHLFLIAVSVLQFGSFSCRHANIYPDPQTIFIRNSGST